MTLVRGGARALRSGMRINMGVRPQKQRFYTLLSPHQPHSVLLLKTGLQYVGKVRAPKKTTVM